MKSTWIIVVLLLYWFSCITTLYHIFTSHVRKLHGRYKLSLRGQVDLFDRVIVELDGKNEKCHFF